MTRSSWFEAVAVMFVIDKAMELPPMPFIADTGPYSGGKRDRRIRTSKYMPHQNTREKARRVRQMAAGQLSPLTA